THLQVILLCAVLALMASSVTSKPADNAPSVSVLRYRNDQDLEAIQRAIIAQYQNQIGGTTQVHAPLTANVINPSNLRVNF
ncbi:hypothetical protein KR038_003384, partial [Drosophila bunnanda]